MTEGKGTPTTPKQEKEAQQSKPWPRRERWGKTNWDWLHLLIVPVLILLITVIFTWQQNVRQNNLEDKRVLQAQKIEEQRAQDLALQGYLDQMSTLVLKDLGDTRVQAVMRARTLTALKRLSPSRKAEVMHFLVEADLVTSSGQRKPVISLNGADLDRTNLWNTDLTGAKLEKAELRGVELWEAFLRDADLINAELGGTNLSFTDLRDADLSNANLSQATLYETDLRGATLYETVFQSASLRKADLTGAKLDPADLRRITHQAKSLKGATMPDGRKYEEWIKDKKSNDQ